MKEWDVTAIQELMFAAGRIALELFEAPPTEHKADNSLVTEADRRIEDFLVEELADEPNGVFVIGEETAHRMDAAAVKAALAGTAWVVDPIDGTAPYANHLPTWGISIGLMEAGVLTNGALFVPRTGDLFLTDGAGAVLCGANSRDPGEWRTGTLLPFAETERPFSTMGMVSLPQEIGHFGRFDGRNPIQANGSAVYSAVKLIQGEYLGYVARIKLWDFAGAVPIFRSLGFTIQFEDGRPLDDAVTERDWILDAESPRCWKSTGLLHIAYDPETVGFLRKKYRVVK